MRKKIARHSALVAASLFICLRVDFFIASAQVQHGRLMGRILDKSGNPISGATIYITCQSATQAAVSNAQGYYTFLNVPPETYKIKAYRRGFNDWLSNISVNANAITRIDVKLAAITNDAVIASVDDEKEEKEDKRNASVAFRKVIPIVRKKESIEVTASAPEKEKIAAELKSENEDDRAAQALINLTDENLNADAIEQITTLESPVSIVGGVESVYKHVKYPDLALKAGVEGKVVAHIFVDKEGNILKVDFLKNINPILDAEVMRVLTEETRFQAAKLTNGQTIAGAIIVPFNFKIKK